MTDKQLYRLCKKYGARVLAARRRFAGLLPEVARRRLWERRGFSSVYELAARLGGLTRQQVDEVLRLERRFVQMPVLRLALVRGEVSAGKLARVASVATAANSGEVLRLASELSYAALDLKVKEIKIANGLFERVAAGKSLCAQNVEGMPGRVAGGGVAGDGQPDGAASDGRAPDGRAAETAACAKGAVFNERGEPVDGRVAAQWTLADLGVSEEVAEKLVLLRACGQDFNALLENLLASMAETRLPDEKPTVAGGEVVCEKPLVVGSEVADEKPTVAPVERLDEKLAMEERFLQEKMAFEIRDRGRQVPLPVKKLLLQKYAGRCAMEGCGKPAEQLHHLREWARGGGHEPANLRPLCRGHHQLAHWEGRGGLKVVG